MGETDLHRDLMIDLIEALRFHYRSVPDVYVSGNILLYYEEGNPQAHLAPDVLVTPGVSRDRREIYKLWEVGKSPELVIEVTSKSTKMRDVGVKKGLYEAMGVQEYLLFDPCGDYLQPRFQVFRSEQGLFVPCLIPESTGYRSRLGLDFKVVDGTLRVFEAATGKLVPSPTELGRLLELETSRADRQESLRQAAESRAEALAKKLRELGIEIEG